MGCSKDVNAGPTSLLSTVPGATELAVVSHLENPAVNLTVLFVVGSLS